MLDNDFVLYLSSIIQGIRVITRRIGRETRRDTREFGKLCSRHRYPYKGTYYRGTRTRYGTPWVFVVNILYTHPGWRRSRRHVCCRGAGKSEGWKGRVRGPWYLRHIILHYVPKRRTNAVLIYASPRGDKRKRAR